MHTFLYQGFECKSIYHKKCPVLFSYFITTQLKVLTAGWLIEQKGMTFYHDFCYSFTFSSSLFLGGKRKGKSITKVVVKSHAFLLHHARKIYFDWFFNHIRQPSNIMIGTIKNIVLIHNSQNCRFILSKLVRGCFQYY